MHKKKESKYK